MKKTMESINKPHPNDIICGRGGRSNIHPGNIRYRKMVNMKADDYIKAPLGKKIPAVYEILNELRSQNPPGRILKWDRIADSWYHISEKEAKRKICQCFRMRRNALKRLEQDHHIHTNRFHTPCFPFNR